MDFNEYQIKTRVTDVGTGKRHRIKPTWLYYVLGIGGETGELLEKIKKHFRDDYGVMTEKKLEEIKKEMGDCLWYHARLADILGIKLDDVAKENITKLLDRKERNVLHGEGDYR
jgi:NTP pyrophosphatase (non-canonical NTP hydrolase)